MKMNLSVFRWGLKACHNEVADRSYVQSQVSKLFRFLLSNCLVEEEVATFSGKK